MDKHWVWLAQCSGITRRNRAALLRYFGTAEKIYSLTLAECRKTEGFQSKWLKPLLDKDLSEAEKIVETCEKKQIRILTYTDAAYPDRLRNIADSPVLLYCRGTIPNFDEEAVIAVVGTRRCSNYGLLQTKQLSKQIAECGGIVLSGGARGIDTMALKAALDSKMPVVCVLGCGVDVAYPPENETLFRQIAQHGCVLSEYPPETAPQRFHFPERNRLLSGLALGVLVVEAPEKSGALLTVAAALEQSRDVYAIPHNLGETSSAGSNRILREGAQIVTDGWDLLSGYCHLFPEKLADARKAENAERIWRARFQNALAVYAPLAMSETYDKKSVDIPRGKLYSDEKEDMPAIPLNISEDERLVLSVLTNEPCYFDEIVCACELPPARITVALVILEIKKLAEKAGGNCYRKC